MKLAIILAKKKSLRIKNKNIIKFQKKPMVWWPIQTAKNTKIFDKIIVSTDSLKIKKIAEQSNVEVPFMRSKKNSQSNSLPIDVIKEVVNKLKLKKNLYICCLFGNSPFSYYKDILEGYKILIKNQNLTTVLPVKKIDSRYQRIFIRNQKNLIEFFCTRTINKLSQDLSDTYIDAGQWFWMKFNPSSTKKIEILSGKLGYVEISDERVCDIDNYSDLKIAKKKAKKIKYIKY